jgi:hypothetical protein
LKRYKFPGIDHILAELIQAGGKVLLPEIYKLTNSIWNKEEFTQQCKVSVIVLLYNKSDKLTEITVK